VRRQQTNIWYTSFTYALHGREMEGQHAAISLEQAEGSKQAQRQYLSVILITVIFLL
jgi:hypothetical protein